MKYLSIILITCFLLLGTYACSHNNKSQDLPAAAETLPLSKTGCCTNCGSEKGSPCNTCNEQHTNSKTGKLECFASEVKANCDDDLKNCKKAED